MQFNSQSVEDHWGVQTLHSLGVGSYLAKAGRLQLPVRVPHVLLHVLQHGLFRVFNASNAQLECLLCHSRSHLMRPHLLVQ